MDLILTILPVVTKDLPISPRFTPYDFLSRCKFSTLTTRPPMVEFYLLTFPRVPLRKKEHKSYFGKNRTHDFRTSRCAGYLLDHSGDEKKNIDQPGKVADPARGQLNTRKMKIFLSPFAPKNLVLRDGCGRPVPHQLAHSPYSGCVWCLLTEFLPISAVYTAIRHQASPKFIGSRNFVPMAFTAESPPAQGQKSSKSFQ